MRVLQHIRSKAVICITGVPIKTFCHIWCASSAFLGRIKQPSILYLTFSLREVSLESTICRTALVKTANSVGASTESCHTPQFTKEDRLTPSLHGMNTWAVLSLCRFTIIRSILSGQPKPSNYHPEGHPVNYIKDFFQIHKGYMRSCALLVGLLGHHVSCDSVNAEPYLQLRDDTLDYLEEYSRSSIEVCQRFPEARFLTIFHGHSCHFSYGKFQQYWQLLSRLELSLLATSLQLANEKLLTRLMCLF